MKGLQPYSFLYPFDLQHINTLLFSLFSLIFTKNTSCFSAFFCIFARK